MFYAGWKGIYLAINMSRPLLSEVEQMLTPIKSPGT